MRNIIYIFIAVVFLSCGREKPDFLGGSLNDQFGELLVLDSLRSSTSDFNFSTVSPRFFEAQWSKNLNWQLDVVGVQSGATKSFTGFSSKLDIDNTSWNGSANDFPSFLTESCVATLVLADNIDTITMSTVVSISELKPLQDNLMLVADFEEGMPVNTIKFVQQGESMTFDIASGQAANGTSYYAMGGIVNWDYYLGSIKVPVDTEEYTNVSPLLLYFNMAVIGGALGEVPANQFMKIYLREDDGERYSYEINPVNWDTWRLVSIPYSEFVLESDAANNTKDPGTINQIEIMSLSCPSGPGTIVGGGTACPENMGLQVKTDIDFIAFSTNESYQP
ncbi:MAG: hypothetical protein ISR00_06815 [Flavobacteriales bacterium]|nr:hypothetical protein [Flavobacteriales bacterium]MBL6873634.1 hypothetical protein [Flavobacteriales bacterium]